jgi:hypothetical protein
VAVKAIDRRLVEELEKLKLAHTKRGDLESANAIVALIKQYEVDQGITKKEDSKPSNVLDLIGTEWTWERPGVVETIEFKRHGMLAHSSWSGKWEILGDRTVSINNGRMSVIKFSADLKTYQIVEGETRVSGKRK